MFPNSDINKVLRKRKIVLFIIFGITAFLLISCNKSSTIEVGNPTQVESIENKGTEELIGEKDNIEYIQYYEQLKKDLIQLTDPSEEYVETINTLVGKKIPSIMMLDENEDIFDTHSLINEEKDSLITIMGTWCPSCAIEVPNMKEVLKNHDIIGYNIAVSSDSYDDVHNFKEENNSDMDYFITHDGEISNKLYLSFVPTYFYIDKEGVILGIFSTINTDVFNSFLDIIN